jgi:hypothetical protein
LKMVTTKVPGGISELVSILKDVFFLFFSYIC